MAKLQSVQKAILIALVRIIDDYNTDEEKLDQALEAVKGMVRRCYLVQNNRGFFNGWFCGELIEELMGESFLERLIRFVFGYQAKDSGKCVIK